jgi:hypothetical protein
MLFSEEIITMSETDPDATVSQGHSKTEKIDLAPKPEKKRGGWFRRLFFILLLLVVVAGMIASAVLLRARFSAALGEIDALNTRVEEVEGNLAQTQADLAAAQQALEDQAADNAAALAALQQDMAYRLLLHQSEAQVVKALFSLGQDNIGQARREIGALRASLAAAAELAGDEEAAALLDLNERAAGAEDDLSDNAFAAAQALEVIWRDLDVLIAAQAGD